MNSQTELRALVEAYVALSLPFKNNEGDLAERHIIAERMAALRNFARHDLGVGSSAFYEFVFAEEARRMNPEAVKRDIAKLKSAMRRQQGRRNSRAQATTREARLGHLAVQVEALETVLRRRHVTCP